MARLVATMTNGEHAADLGCICLHRVEVPMRRRAMQPVFDSACPYERNLLALS
jgi:hypothetical protein